MRNWKLKIVLACLSVGMAGSPAFAATFCLSGYGLSPQCMYDDVTSCLREAEPPSTNCTVNPEAVLSYTGGNNYCLVTSSLIAQCIYVDRAQCNSEASARSGLCVDRSDSRGPNDPFKYDNRIQN